MIFRKNFINSPYGWSAWTAYVKYYLYLLTGRERYLLELFNCLGACVQLMDGQGTFAGPLPMTRLSVEKGLCRMKAGGYPTDIPQRRWKHLPIEKSISRPFAARSTSKRCPVGTEPVTEAYGRL